MSKLLMLGYFFSTIFLFSQEAEYKKDLEKVPINIRSIHRHPVHDKGEFVCFARIVLLEYGWEHVHSPVGIQWIFDDQDKRVNIIKYEKIVKGLDSWSLAIKSAKPFDDYLEVILSGTHTYAFTEKTFKLRIYPNGTCKLTE